MASSSEGTLPLPWTSTGSWNAAGGDEGRGSQGRYSSENSEYSDECRPRNAVRPTHMEYFDDGVNYDIFDNEVASHPHVDPRVMERTWRTMTSRTAASRTANAMGSWKLRQHYKKLVHCKNRVSPVSQAKASGAVAGEAGTEEEDGAENQGAVPHAAAANGNGLHKVPNGKAGYTHDVSADHNQEMNSAMSSSSSSAWHTHGNGYHQPASQSPPLVPKATAAEGGTAAKSHAKFTLPAGASQTEGRSYRPLRAGSSLTEGDLPGFIDRPAAEDTDEEEDEPSDDEAA